MEERQRHDLVDRHDLRVAERRREQLTELLESRLHALVVRYRLAVVMTGKP